MLNLLYARNDFPVTAKLIYLDSGAKSALATPVYDAIRSFYNICFERGRDYNLWWEQVDSARAKVAKILAADPADIAFLSSATHAANVVAQGIEWKPGDNVVAAEDEFPSNLYPWLNLRAKGVDIRLVPSEDGQLPLEAYKKHTDSRTRLIAVSHVQASTGYRCNLQELGNYTHENSIMLFVDATQSCGVLPIDVGRFHIDYLCSSTYKWLLGTDGLAILYARASRADDLSFSYLGWAGRVNPNDYSHHDLIYPKETRRFELGNHNYSAIWALNAGLDYLERIGRDNTSRYTMDLVCELKKQLSEIDGISLISSFDREHSGPLVTITSYAMDNARIYEQLLSKGVAASLKPNGIRLSPYFYNTSQEIGLACEVLRKIVAGNLEV
ncbi:MAG: aminotransferase class V-fold PLP-dependent enzyme [Clostridiaceae bacterium]